MTEYSCDADTCTGIDSDECLRSLDIIVESMNDEKRLALQVSW